LRILPSKSASGITQNFFFVSSGKVQIYPAANSSGDKGEKLEKKCVEVVIKTKNQCGGANNPSITAYDHLGKVVQFVNSHNKDGSWETLSVKAPENRDYISSIIIWGVEELIEKICFSYK
jgi:hypothetical protein